VREDWLDHETVSNPAKMMMASVLNPCFLYIVIQICYL